MDEVVRAKLYC